MSEINFDTSIYDEEQKQELKNCFDDGDADVFENLGTANGWIGECDEDDLAAAKEKVDQPYDRQKWKSLYREDGHR